MAERRTDRKFLFQESKRSILESDLTQQKWISLIEQTESKEEKTFRFCALVRNEYLQEALEEQHWNLEYTDGYPSCSTNFDQTQVSYDRFGSVFGKGIEPFIYRRHWHSLKPDCAELSEEFRLFHNLYYDPSQKAYLKLTEGGNMEAVVKIVGDMQIEVRIKELRQYLAVRDMALLLFVQGYRYSQEDAPENEVRIQEKGETFTYGLFVGSGDSLMSDCKSYSLLTGKAVLPALPKEKSDCWPYDKGKARKYEEFIIGEDSDGEPLTFTCNPSKLGNGFGGNSKAPDFLTNVFFKKDVLQNYYAKPSMYSVEDGYLRCGGLWGLRMDNHHNDYVVVHLGELGQSLCCEEQLRWKSFNIPPCGGLSRITFKREFLNEPCDSDQLDIRFKSDFSSLNETWEKKFGWPLFKSLHKKDQHCFDALRIPLTDEDSEFDSMVQGLTKTVIDSLNEPELAKGMKNPSNAKGITKLEAFLKASKVSGWEEHIKFFRNLQDLRSKGSAHRKGSDYESQKMYEYFEIGAKQPAELFRDILTKMIDFLEFLKKFEFLENGAANDF